MTTTTETELTALLNRATETGESDGLYVVVPVADLQKWLQLTMEQTWEKGGKGQAHRAAAHLILTLNKLGYLKRVGQ